MKLARFDRFLYRIDFNIFFPQSDPDKQSGSEDHFKMGREGV